MAKSAASGAKLSRCSEANDYNGAVSLMTGRVAEVIADDAGIQLTGAVPTCRHYRAPGQQPSPGLSLAGIICSHCYWFDFALHHALRERCCVDAPFRRTSGGGRGGGWRGGGGGGFGGGGGVSAASAAAVPAAVGRAAVGSKRGRGI